jgi:hypothetical protein
MLSPAYLYTDSERKPLWTSWMSRWFDSWSWLDSWSRIGKSNYRANETGNNPCASQIPQRRLPPLSLCSLSQPILPSRSPYKCNSSHTSHARSSNALCSGPSSCGGGVLFRQVKGRPVLSHQGCQVANVICVEVVQHGQTCTGSALLSEPNQHVSTPTQVHAASATDVICHSPPPSVIVCVGVARLVHITELLVLCRG